MTFKTNPEKSKVIIDGKMKGKTPKALAIFYKENTELITVVVRKEGYINFTDQLRPPFPEEKVYNLVLKPF